METTTFIGQEHLLHRGNQAIGIVRILYEQSGNLAFTIDLAKKASQNAKLFGLRPFTTPIPRGGVKIEKVYVDDSRRDSNGHSRIKFYWRTET